MTVRLTHRLHQVALVYDDLADAAAGMRSAAGGDGMPRGGRDPRDRPAPGNLEAMEHRHKLLRGLRWWVDAVREGGSRHRRMGDSPRNMCAFLYSQLDAMAPEDRAELDANLADWLAGAYPLLGDVDPAPTKATVPLPVEAYSQRMRVADAAAVLGCTVRTIQRRVPADRRAGGMVVLGDAARACRECGQPEGLCEHTRCQQCLLIVGQCAHTHGVRNGTPLLAQ